MTTKEQRSLENEVGDMFCNYAELVDRIQVGEANLEQEKDDLLTEIIQKLDNLGYQFQDRYHAEIWILGGSCLLRR